MVGYKYAMEIAESFCNEIKAFCEPPTPIIVGSLRRKCSQVNDIDIVVIPKIEKTKDDTLFGEPVDINILDRKLAELCFDERMKVDVSGSKIKRFLEFDNSEVPIDVYIADSETLPTLLLIRTGSKLHNIKLCVRARDMRLQLKANGEGLIDAQLRPIKVLSEEDIFKILGFAFVPPEGRND
jgi:DNA polymerase/3'-5' exonuclease PolX